MSAQVVFSERTRGFLDCAAFYAATAIPMSYVFYLLPAVLREAGHPADEISLLSLVYLPYALRLFWAPAVDRIAAGRLAAYRRILQATTLLGAAMTLAFGFVKPEAGLLPVMAIATALFVVLATGAAALDGYAVAAFDEPGRRRASVWQTIGFTFGGAALGLLALLSEGMGARFQIGLIAAATLLAALPLFRRERAAGAARSRPEAEAASFKAFAAFLRKPEVGRLLLVSIPAKLGMGMVAGYLPILQVDLGVSASQAGFFGALGGNVIGLGVAVVSGAALLRWGGYRAIGWMCALAVLGFGFAAASYADLQGPIFAVGLSLVFLSLGYAWVAPYKALTLALCDGGGAASKAAFLASIDLTLAVVAAAVSGTMAQAMGLPAFFLLSGALSLAAMLLAFREDRRGRVSSLISERTAA